MGQTGSRVAGKIVSSFSFSGAGSDLDDAAAAGANMLVPRFPGQSVLVYSRRGSMYFDEDGDLAHEFYEEIVSSSTPRSKRKGKLRCRKMKKVNAKHLRPQGEVEYPHPRLHVDCPVILHQG